MRLYTKDIEEFVFRYITITIGSSWTRDVALLNCKLFCNCFRCGESGQLVGWKGFPGSNVHSFFVTPWIIYIFVSQCIYLFGVQGIGREAFGRRLLYLEQVSSEGGQLKCDGIRTFLGLQRCFLVSSYVVSDLPRTANSEQADQADPVGSRER
ncbi:hypothetical protein Agabi119p4_9704 [Agaricus bisporus var. burnettii]|uniref:Uncharacterized protein n=1 Tax=Agaricus bisporus var. burnettii TaxID=192524 RepID=A0A8H7EX96_AGABI|nr:hypothetical protein Agabi119p4_9704 [Agaricus bisporus var. burnettii]